MLAVYLLHLFNIIHASNTVLTSGNYSCPDNGGTCTITCNTDLAASNAIIDCGNANDCYYYCDASNCNQNGEIRAENVLNLYIIQGSNADECIRDSTIYTPNNGNAILTTSATSRRPYRDTIIQGGTSQNIIISTNTSNDGNDLREFKVN